MSFVAAAVVGGAVVGAVATSKSASKSAAAADRASDAQSQQAYAAMDLQQEQFQRVQDLLNPYVAVGHEGLRGQQALTGLYGPEAQQWAIGNIEKSPYFSGLVKQGENAILQNASATGGLRGGNTQAALAQFRPNMLSAAIDQQYQRLSGMVNIGQNAAAGVGNSGQAMANANSNLLGQVGAAQAGGYLAQGRAQAQGINGIASAFGTAAPQLAGYFNQPSYGQGITGTAGGNAGAFSTGATLNNEFGGAATYF